MSARIHGLALALGDGKGVYIPVGDDPRGEAMLIAPLFEEGAPIAVSCDMKRDYLLLKRLGITMRNRYFDTSVAHYLISPETKHTPEKLAMAYLHYETIPSSASRQRIDAPCELAGVALRLRDPLKAELAANDLTPLLDDIELPMVKVLAEMEWTGVRVDTAELADLSRAYTERLDAMEERAYMLAGGKFNIASPMQVGEVLFERLHIDPNAKRTKRGAYSTTEEILEKYRADHEIVDLILDRKSVV